MSIRSAKPHEAKAAPAPWYRHRWPWLLIAGPFIVALGCILTIRLAFYREDGIIAADYYKRGLKVGEDVSRIHKAQNLALEGTLIHSHDGYWHITLHANDSKAFPDTLNYSLIHPTQHGRDQQWKLIRIPSTSNMLKNKSSSSIPDATDIPTQSNSGQLAISADYRSSIPVDIVPLTQTRWHLRVETPTWRLDRSNTWFKPDTSSHHQLLLKYNQAAPAGSAASKP